MLRSRTFALLCLALAACTDEPEAEYRTYKFHAVAGISMGAIGASLNAAAGLEKIDALGAMGGPFDVAYMLGVMERQQMGGFCPLPRLEALLAQDPAKLHDPAALDCTASVPPRVEHELPNHFNHWAFSTQGSTFDRDKYLTIFYDLSLALGNPLLYNPDSPVFPPGVTRANFKPELCDKPVVHKKFYNKEYNPEGKYDVITFCDGQPELMYCSDPAKTRVDWCQTDDAGAFCRQRFGADARALAAGKRSDQNQDLLFDRSGVYDPCWKPRLPASFALAVDLNGNGRRDYHEPLVVNAHERWQDTGADGCFDEREDGQGGCTASGATGDPNRDNYEAAGAPLGTQGNWTREDGEPYEDFGLDGVADTKDFGEGNGSYDDSPWRKHALSIDFRQNYLRMSAQQRRQIDVYAEGGIRDVFNLGISGDQLFAAVHGLEPAQSKRYLGFTELPPLPGTDWTRMFDPLAIDFSAVPRNIFVRYGSATATVKEQRDGDGGHVGTPVELAGRFGTFFKWLSERWTPALGPVEARRGLGTRITTFYFSEVLKAPREFAIALPPGYEEDTQRRYPVLFMGHGYGMQPGGMTDFNIVLDAFMTGGDIHPMIVVYPSGRCCFVRPDGTKDCRETDEQGNELKEMPGYERECDTGNFYANRPGFAPGDETRYGAALWELMDHVDRNYRVLAPRKVPLAGSAP